MIGAALALAGYLLGSVPFSLWVARWSRGVDLRQHGSRNPGATNVLRVVGAGPAVLALALDLGKGVLPVSIGVALGVSRGWLAAIALTAVVGHVFPVFLRFHGGKGVATAAGALAALSPVAFLPALAVFGVVAWTTRYVSLASTTATASYPLWRLLAATTGWGGRLGPGEAIGITLVAALILVRHRGNFRRLRAGVEPRLGTGGRSG